MDRRLSLWGLALGGLMVAASGCAPAGRMMLGQSHLAGYQHQVQLESDHVYWSASDETCRVLAEFPLPGARTGHPTYLLYLRMPAAAKTASLAAVADSDQACGFLIQTRGEYAGLTRIVDGNVEVRAPLVPGTSKRRIRIDAKCEDGTQLAGEFNATHDDYQVGHFENRQRPADVQNLRKPASPAPASQPRR